MWTLLTSGLGTNRRTPVTNAGNTWHGEGLRKVYKESKNRSISHSHRFLTHPSILVATTMASHSPIPATTVVSIVASVTVFPASWGIVLCGFLRRVNVGDLAEPQFAPSSQLSFPDCYSGAFGKAGSNSGQVSSKATVGMFDGHLRRARLVHWGAVVDLRGCSRDDLGQIAVHECRNHFDTEMPSFQTPYWKLWASMMQGMFVFLVAQYGRWPHHDAVALAPGLEPSLSPPSDLLVLPISKNSVLASSFGLPYTATLRMHRWLSWAVWWGTVLHLFVTVLSYAMDETALYTLFFTADYTQPWGNFNYIFITGMAAFFSLGVMALTALPWVRRNAYNVFFWTHFLGLAAIFVGSLHASMTIFYAIPVTREECGYTTIIFARVIVPELTRFQAHPWSVAASDVETVTFFVGPARSTFGVENWTNGIFDWRDLKTSSYYFHRSTNLILFLLHQTLPVAMQGPYGSPITFSQDCNSFDLVVFFVGGTGATPAIAEISSRLVRSNISKPDCDSLLDADDKIQPSTKPRIPLRVVCSRRQSSETQSHQTLGAERLSGCGLNLAPVESPFKGTAFPLVSRHRASLKAVLHKGIEGLGGEKAKPTVGVFVEEALADEDLANREGWAAVEVVVESFSI
ncbi:hypothetical protein M427DRAFT_144469 [Gonapodya prolifera JEL478]|uniref:Ferric oxidoreductase domain-containing protein n=1 Tax=Gonapodya prolifera (strain JEL478) TaxID=1344416 RepID=A0A139AL42_GONPJ|nr:hypothetical protein M427DRAFT_144469 [Gonapodya prolifera JEL478]|eukprot:KXS17244.1 hypothetical protein M427DRAFT_144469 [Gonapodya prolifera JEL478]